MKVQNVKIDEDGNFTFSWRNFSNKNDLCEMSRVTYIHKGKISKLIHWKVENQCAERWPNAEAVKKDITLSNPYLY